MTRSRTSQSELERLALALSTRPELRSARAEAREVFRGHPNAATPDGSAALADAALQHFYGAIQLATISDPANPEILAAFLYEHPIAEGETFPSALHGGLENPDNVYRLLAVGADWRYKLTGVRPADAPAQVTYELMDTVPGVDGIGDQLGLLTDREIEFADDGTFTITIDADAAGGRANHIHCPEAAKALFIRDTLSDWTTQRPNQLRIAAVDGPRRPVRGLDEMAREAAELIPRYSRFWNEFRDRFVATMKLKTNVFDPPMQRAGAWGYIANTHFQLNAEQGLVFTTDAGAAPYHAVMIGNSWWVTHDASRRSGAYNTAQATRNSDGSMTFVIAATDPGVANWLDTAGLLSGIVQVRWQGATPGGPPPDIRDVQVVRVADLAALLAPVSPQERQAELAERHASYLSRLARL